MDFNLDAMKRYGFEFWDFGTMYVQTSLGVSKVREQVLLMPKVKRFNWKRLRFQEQRMRLTYWDGAPVKLEHEWC